jgi:hypothetical protein
VNEEKNNSSESDPFKGEADEIRQARERSVTGLGMISALIVACWSLVADGELPLSDYLLFVAFLLVCASALAWQIWKLAPPRGAEAHGQGKAGSLKV